MEDKSFDPKYGIDPRQKANIRGNGKNIPNGIDWDALMSAGLDKWPKKLQTDLGFINDQIKRSNERDKN